MMNNSPLISVIMPIYNVEKYLSACLDSVLAQTFQDIEIICVNDGSTDTSTEILHEYAKKDERIRIISQTNQGQSVARNYGYREARGKYIYYMDSDDVIHKQLLEIVYHLAQTHDADMVCFQYQKNFNAVLAQKVIDWKTLKFKLTDNPLLVSLHARHFRMTFNVWSKFFKREMLNDISFVKGIHFQDWPYVYEVLTKHPRTIIIDEKLYFYTINPASVSNVKCNPKQIADYHAGIVDLYDFCKREYKNKEFAYLKKKLIPSLLKNQLRRCEASNPEVSEEMWSRFAKELSDLKDKNILSWQGHSLWHYFKYCRLIRQNKIKNA